MAERVYKIEKTQGSTYFVGLYEGGNWLHTYKGYMNPYCALGMKLYPYQVGTGVSSGKIPGKHEISCLDIKNFWERKRK